VPAVDGEAVFTVTVTGCAELPLICTEELEKLQVGAGVAIGLMLQLRLTAPLKDSDGLTTKRNFALCPTLMVCEADDPDPAPTLKSGAVAPRPDRATVCGLTAALSVIVMPPARLLGEEGVNVTEI